IGGIIYAVLPFALMHDLVKSSGCFAGAYNPNILLGVILLIWSNDTFAYLGGSVFGKNKMIERVSPGKTWEGTIFGVILTIGSGYIIGNNILSENQSVWLVLGLVVPVFATIGDLIESMLKRQAGVKDSGNIMPGHGGVLDRFDSLIFVSPFVFLLMDLLT
ncbi:MAG: phosphatidate cytidylyltransferase, partial [Bacteroidia bacterium]|nr:phosphatidate cytidylyltransferase [Bacteroidia bacterium]